MKKLLLLIGIVFVACSPDSEPTPTKVTTATKNTEKRTLLVDYNAQKTISDTGYLPHGTGVFYSNNENDCGLKLGGSETSQVGYLDGLKVQVTTFYRYNVTCN